MYIYYVMVLKHILKFVFTCKTVIIFPKLKTLCFKVEAVFQIGVFQDVWSRTNSPKPGHTGTSRNLRAIVPDTLDTVDTIPLHTGFYCEQGRGKVTSDLSRGSFPITFKSEVAFAAILDYLCLESCLTG